MILTAYNWIFSLFTLRAKHDEIEKLNGGKAVIEWTFDSISNRSGMFGCKFPSSLRARNEENLIRKYLIRAIELQIELNNLFCATVVARLRRSEDFQRKLQVNVSISQNAKEITVMNRRALTSQVNLNLFSSFNNKTNSRKRSH